MQRTTPHRRAVILGAGGFIGINLAHALAKDGCELICFDRFQCHYWPTNVKAIVGDFSQLCTTLSVHVAPTSTQKLQQTKLLPMYPLRYVISNILVAKISDGFLYLPAAQYMVQTHLAQQRKTHRPTRSVHMAL